MCAQIIALFILCASASSGESLPTFVFADFASAVGLRVAGTARVSGKVLRLTGAAPWMSGAAWAPEKEEVASGFETTFQFQLSGQGGLGRGADGFAFVLQNSGPAAIAGRGAAGGFALGDGVGRTDSPGIPHSIAVFFDTFRNAGDPSGNYVAVCTNGNIAEMRWPPPRLAFQRRLHVHLKDGRIHTVRIAYRPPILSVFLDRPERPVLMSTADLSSVVDADGRAYVGFTASTGAGYENHDILSWSFSKGIKPAVSSNIAFVKAACLPARNLCTPDQAVVDEAGPGRYHIVLPANLEWGASILNPSERPITVNNARGIICWDAKRLPEGGCSGPAVEVVVGGSPAETKAGTLITRTTGGRTYFSLNDRKGEFEDNEGFIEFDVEIR